MASVKRYPRAILSTPRYLRVLYLTQQGTQSSTPKTLSDGVCFNRGHKVSNHLEPKQTPYRARFRGFIFRNISRKPYRIRGGNMKPCGFPPIGTSWCRQLWPAAGPTVLRYLESNDYRRPLFGGLLRRLASRHGVSSPRVAWLRTMVSRTDTHQQQDDGIWVGPRKRYIVFVALRV